MKENPKYWTLTKDGHASQAYFTDQDLKKHESWIKQNNYEVVEIPEEQYQRVGLNKKEK